MEPTSSLRPLALLAGPAVIAGLLLAVAAAATARGPVEASPLATASTALVLVGLLATGALAVSLLGRGAGPVVALLGTVLVAGGEWASLFVLPGLSTAAPHLLESGSLPGVPIGFVASYAVFAVGWGITAVGLLRARAVPRWTAVLLLAGAVLSMVPTLEPARLLVLSCAVSLTASRLRTRVAVPV